MRVVNSTDASDEYSGVVSGSAGLKR